MQDQILEELYRPFSNVRERKGQGNKTFRYVASNDIVDRMNKVFKGNWTVEITHFEIIEDNVLVRVRVSVNDPNPSVSMFYSQEAFASHTLARFTTGDRKGQVIDLGNSYRAAVSKALKAAVARWGVGLYMDEDLEESEGSHSTQAPSIPVPGFVPSQEKAASGPTVYGPPAKIFQSSTPPPFPTTPPTKVESSASTLPPFQVSGGSEDRRPADKSMVNTPPVVVPTTTEEPEYLTDVQKVALETILQMNGLEYEATARKVLETDVFPPIGKLLYMQAVKMIQYGNNLKLGK